jgi:hypothetical protein
METCWLVGFTTQGDGEATRVVISKVRMPPILLDPRAADGARATLIPIEKMLFRCLTDTVRDQRSCT